MAAIVHSGMVKLYDGPRSISGALGVSLAQSSVNAFLTQPSCVLSADVNGLVENYGPATTTIVVEVSGRVDTSNWTISTAKSDSVGAVAVNGATVSVASMTEDAGWVDITASKTGYAPVTRRFTVAKVRQKGGVRTVTALPESPEGVNGELAIFLDTTDANVRGLYGWSGTAWVRTSDIAAGSVTADKLAAGAIQATKFANGIEPISIVDLLPNVTGYTGTKLVFLTTDNKIYRYAGTTWTKEIPTSDLTGTITADQLASNSVTTGKIQAGAVTTDQLAAKAVTATRMTLTDTSNVYPDYDILDSGFYSGSSFQRIASLYTEHGAYLLSLSAKQQESRVQSQWFQIEPSTDYFVEISAVRSSTDEAGAAAAYIELGYFSGGTTTPTLSRSLLISRKSGTTNAARADIAITTQSNERRARLVFVREAGGTGWAWFGGPVVRRRNNAKMIVDGSIVADKLATNAVESKHILAGAVTAEKLSVNKLSAISADLGDATAGTFTVSSTGFIKGGATDYTSGTGFWMGFHDNKYKWRVGTPGSSGAEWTGSAFNVYGPDGSVTISSGVVDWDAISGENKPQHGATRNVFRGDWTASTSYAVGDIVLKDGNGWSCILAHTSASGNQPPASGSGNDWWALYAVKGSDGAQGLHALTVLVPNSAHTLPAASDGTVSSYTGSGTTIQVFEGTTALSAVSSITANGQFTVGTPTQVPASTITVGARSYADTTATVAQHSAMAAGADSVVVTYPITVRRTDGTTVSLSATQTLTKSKAGAQGVDGAPGPAGPAVVVTANRALTFTATDGALDGSQADIVLTAAVSGIPSPTYVWTFSGLQTNPTASTTNSQTITAAQFGTSKSATVTCTVSGAYTDQVTIVRLEKSTAEAGATKNTIYRQSTTPSGATNGDIWIDTSTTPNVEKILVSGAWQVAATVGATFDTGQAGSIAGQITSSNVTTYIDNAAIGNAQIGNIIQSNNYVPNSSGWYINKSGFCEFQDGLFRGTIKGSIIDGATIISTNQLQPTDAGAPYYTSLFNQVATRTADFVKSGYAGREHRATTAAIGFYAYNQGPANTSTYARYKNYTITLTLDVSHSSPVVDNETEYLLVQLVRKDTGAAIRTLVERRISTGVNTVVSGLTVQYGYGFALRITGSFTHNHNQAYDLGLYVYYNTGRNSGSDSGSGSASITGETL